MMTVVGFSWVEIVCYCVLRNVSIIYIGGILIITYKGYFVLKIILDDGLSHSYFYTEILSGIVVLWCSFSSETSEKNPQFNFSCQNLSLERNFFKWDGKETKILHLLFHRIWKNNIPRVSKFVVLSVAFFSTLNVTPTFP